MVEEFEVDETLVPSPLPPDYNVAPTKNVYVVMERRRCDGSDASGAEHVPSSTDVPRQLRIARWGLVPSWAKDLSIGSRMINARLETLGHKPAFRRAFVKRRCLLPADGYFEWYTPAETSDAPRTKNGRPRKQPFFIKPHDGSSLAMAGLYEWWLPPGAERDAPDAWLLSTVIVTTEAADPLGHIHDRMPVVVPRTRWDEWLDPDVSDTRRVQEMLAPAASQPLVAYPVSVAVNDVRNNGARLVEPTGPEGEPDTPST